MDKQLDKTIKAILAMDPEEAEKVDDLDISLKQPKARDLFSLKMAPEFKAALNQEAQKERRSLTNWIVNVLIDKINWKGKV